MTPVAEMSRAVRPLALGLSLVVALGACDTLRKLRAGLRDVETDDSMGRATLRVEVDPPDGITILLDGARVASVSPWIGKNLKAGPHMLQVRAMGYHSITIPVELVDDESVSVPVALRPRPAADPAARTPRKGRAGPAKETAPPPPPPPQSAGPQVPKGVRAIELTVAPTPGAPLVLDGIAVEGRTVTLSRTHGTLAVGDVTFQYRIGGRGLLFITPPSDGATYELDGRPVPPGSAFKQHVGISRLQRKAGDGAGLTLLIKR